MGGEEEFGRVENCTLLSYFLSSLLFVYISVFS